MTELDIPKIEASLGHIFEDKELVKLAFTHRSYYNENRNSVLGHNERLEFLGDSVLGLIVSGYIYEHLPSKSEGHLSHLRSHLVGADACVLYLRALQVEEDILLGKGESVNVGRGRERILADLLEAIIGAIYLDAGLDRARDFFLTHFADYIDRSMESPLRNWKADLQDYSQKKTQKPPVYSVVEESGLPHERLFQVAVAIDGVEVGRGDGPSKKQAEMDAAENALRMMEKEESDGQD